MHEEPLSMDTVKYSKGMECVSVLSDSVITNELWDELYENGVRMAITRCVGMEHMNKEYANSIGIDVFNTSYSSSSVADYTIMMMLMTLRHVRAIIQRYSCGDFTQIGFQGRELHNMTVGIIGAGSIGITVARHLSGFGCKIIYWSRTKKTDMEPFAEYIDLNDVLRNSDIISLHLCANSETEHIMNKERITMMTQNAILINTGRGSLIDTKALIEALEEKHLSGAALDVVEGDRNIYYHDHKNEIINHHEMAILNSMPNVLMLPHLAFYTDQAIEDMVHNSFRIISEWKQKQEKRKVS